MPKKLILGRVVDLDDHRQGVIPLANQLNEHDVRVLDHQKRLAALIAAAYLFQTERESMHSLETLIEAARAL